MPNNGRIKIPAKTYEMGYPYLVRAAREPLSAVEDCKQIHYGTPVQLSSNPLDKLNRVLPKANEREYPLNHPERPISKLFSSNLVFLKPL